MIKLEVLTLNDSLRWDKIVSGFENADAYYLSGYVKALKDHGDGEPLLFYFESRTTKAINVVMKRDIAECECFRNKLEKDKYFDLTTPYGYGGWLINGKYTNKFFREYSKWCRSNNVVSEFVRFHPVLENEDLGKHFYLVKRIGKTISIKLDSEESVWNSFSKKNRNVIRKAISNDVTIRKTNDGKSLEDFREIYKQTMDRDNASNYYYFEDKYFDTLFDTLGDHIYLFEAIKDNIPIASSIVLKFNDKLSYHLSGSKKDFGYYAPTNLLLWEVCKWGVENHCSSFHLGGGVGGSDDGLFHFKKSFTKDEPLDFYIGTKIYSKKVYKELVDMRGNIENSNYFPLYRG